MSINSRFAFLLLTYSILFTPTSIAWWNEYCADGGQCANMIKSYEALIQGEGCRSFYRTGKCTRICTFSLKSLIGRQTWSKCAERCEWSKAFTTAAQSWLRMCLARPAPDVFQRENDISNSTSTLSFDHIAKPFLSTESSEDVKRQRPNIFRTIWFCIVVGLLVVFGLVLASNPALRTRLRYAIRRGKGGLRQFPQGKLPGRTVARMGPLDLGPNRQELRALQRGARRHLKAFRETNLD